MNNIPAIDTKIISYSRIVYDVIGHVKTKTKKIIPQTTKNKTPKNSKKQQQEKIEEIEIEEITKIKIISEYLKEPITIDIEQLKNFELWI